MFRKQLLAVAMILFSIPANAENSGHPVVLELFTSQGCSSCPPADALLKQLSGADADIVPLSFHVHYWDRLGWKDTYSSPEYTDRQRTYEHVLEKNNIFTPQLIVNGTVSVVGSRTGDVREAIAAAKETPVAVNVSLKPFNRSQMIATLTASNPSVAQMQTDIWEIQFDPDAKTSVMAGENEGETLESINNVTSMKSLGTWQATDSKTIPFDIPANGNVAVIVQKQGQGAILGAAILKNNIIE